MNPTAQLHGDCPLSGPAGVPPLHWGTSWHTLSMPRVQQPLFPGYPGSYFDILRHSDHSLETILTMSLIERICTSAGGRFMIAVLTCFDNIAVFIAGNEPFHCLWHMFFFPGFGRCLPGGMRSFGIAFTSFSDAPMSCFFPGPSDPRRCSKMPAEWCDSGVKWIKVCFSQCTSTV